MTWAVGEAAAMARTSCPSPQPGTRTPPSIGPRLPSHSNKGGAGAPFSQGISPGRYLSSQFILTTNCREKGLNQKRDPNHADSQTDQPKWSASDQDRNRPDRDSALEHRHAAGQNLVGTQMGLSLLLQFVSLFRDQLFVPLI